MFRSEAFPEFVFIDDAGEERRVDLRAMTPRIRAVAALIGEKVAPHSTVGLMYPSSPELVINWLACLAAQVHPLVMQYPTKKQSRAYWVDSVKNTIAVAQVAAVLCDEHCASLGLRGLVSAISQAALDQQPDGSAAPLILDDFAIIQLSSGTTGYRKAVKFESAALRRHVSDFNEVLKLGRGDKIVSWLPLYHDMGYVACFVMPLMLGIEVVMMDPMTWVRKPEMLYDAIARHRATICYMPNFGFEVMSRCAPKDLSSMRWWISCSEPVSADTARKFLQASGAAPESFAPCYAMAENIFAVSIRRGLETRTIDAAGVVSCGTPVPNVEVRIFDHQVWVRSPTSLAAYLGGEDIRDAAGFYPTGDLGEIIDGELYVTGRMQDLLIQAGRKYMLSDIDLVLNRFYPDIRGRAAAIQLYDQRLGTQKPVVLIENADFFQRGDRADIADVLKSAIGLDQIDVHFVPPRFLTKTSSGKFNRRKSAENWSLFRTAAEGARTRAEDPLAELHASFPNVDWQLPVAEVLDSLSLTVLRIILGGTPVRYDGTLTLAAIAAALKKGTPRARAKAAEAIRIVSLADRRVLRDLQEEHVDRLSQRLGCPVTLEHICLPPSPIVLSDLIFHDYFQPRLPQDDFSGVTRAFAKLREASLLLTDDVAEMFFPPAQVYGVLSHNLERDPNADLVGVRWQRYPQYHDRLPLTVVAGADLPLEHRTNTLAQLSAYLGKPIFRIATIQGFAKFTTGWDYRSLKGVSGAPGGIEVVDPDDFVERLATWIARLETPPERRPAPGAAKLEMTELAHYCSHFTAKDNVDKLLAKFDSFCIVGQTASVPYIRKELQRLGKKFVEVRSYAPEILRTLPEKFDCLLICGSQGNFPIEVPAAAIMTAQRKWTTLHIDDPELRDLTFTIEKHKAPRSGTDWFYPFEMNRRRNVAEFQQVRQAAAAAVKRLRDEQRARRLNRRARREVRRVTREVHQS